MKQVSSWNDIDISERTEIRRREIEEIKRKFFESKIVIPEDKIVELSDVAWQENRTSRGNPIGYILVNNAADSKKREFIFAYSQKGLEIARGKGFRNLTAFPDVNKVYVSKQTIFPSFLTKLPQKAREDLRGQVQDETDLLIRFSGVITDDFILLPPNYFGRQKRESASQVILSNIGSIDTNNVLNSGPVKINVSYCGTKQKTVHEEYGEE